MKNPLPSARRRLTGSLLTASVGAAALIASACATSTAQTADLAGGEEDVKAEVRVQSIFISDDSDETRNVRILKNGEEIDLEELDIEGLEGKRQIRIITQDHNGPTALNDSNVFVMKANSDNPRPDSAAFAAKIRELSKDAAKNQAEIQALAQAFEAEMEAWAEAHSKLITGHAVFASSDFSWTEDNADCGEGGTQTRTVIVNRDDDTGSEEKTVTVHCSTKTIDTAAIMANLRDRGDLSDERLADIEARLEEAKERLANGQTSGGKIRFNFDVDTEKSEGE